MYSCEMEGNADAKAKKHQRSLVGGERRGHGCVVYVQNVLEDRAVTQEALLLRAYPRVEYAFPP